MTDVTITVTLTKKEAERCAQLWAPHGGELNSAKRKIARELEKAMRMRIPEPPWGSIVVAGRPGIDMMDDLSRREWIRFSDGTYRWRDREGHSAIWDQLVNPELVR